MEIGEASMHGRERMRMRECGNPCKKMSRGFSALSTIRRSAILGTVARISAAPTARIQKGLIRYLYIVADRSRSHFKELSLERAPPSLAIAEFAIATLIKMGFPQRAAEGVISICSCHKEAKNRGGYICPRCKELLARTCFGCQQSLMDPVNKPGLSVACPKCKQQFCLDCDIYIHESLQYCPGCERLRRSKTYHAIEECTAAYFSLTSRK